MLFVEQNIKFHKNKTESKLENPLHSFREMNHVVQPVEELWIKSKTVMSWSLQKKKECFFCSFVQRNFF